MRDARLTLPFPLRSGPADRSTGSLQAQSRAFLTLLSYLTARNLKLKYHRSFFGFIWTLLNPLATTVTLIVVFGQFIKIPVPDYWAFLISGYFVWSFLNLTMSSGTYLLAQHTSLIRGASVPPEVFPLAAVSARLIEFSAELAIVITAVALFHHQALPASFALLPLLLLMQLLLGLGLMLPIATLGAFYDDAQHTLPVVMLIVFYLSPVVYPQALVPERLELIYAMNPIAHLLGLYHTVLYQGTAPAIPDLLATLGISTGLCTLGILMFRRYRGVFAEVL
jgi:ABC-type polysaccharide/polyol phosphate export permease